MAAERRFDNSADLEDFLNPDDGGGLRPRAQPSKKYVPFANHQQNIVVAQKTANVPPAPELTNPDEGVREYLRLAHFFGHMSATAGLPAHHNNDELLDSLVDSFNSGEPADFMQHLGALGTHGLSAATHEG